MTVRFYSSVSAETTLTNAINNSVTSMQVGSTTGLPTVPFTMAVDYESASEELVEVTVVAGTTLTITRAIDGTSATSHNSGARVRHVSSARDFTDSRDHENASTNVHGLAGGAAVVGTSSTQTLTNKTISGGTISGTIAGSPTFSGTVAFGSNISVAGNIAGNPTFTGTPAFTNATISGTISGNPTVSGTLNTTGNILSTTSVVNPSLSTAVSGDTFDRFRLLSDGNMAWGSGSAARDTNLFRSAADTLRTDDNFIVGDDLSVTNNLTVSGTVTASQSATITGNLTVGGVGQILFARKTADTSRSSTITATPDPHLTVAVSANSTYEVDAYIIYNANTTGDFGMQFGVPAGASGSWSGVGWGRDAGASVGTGGWTVRMNENSITQNRTYGGDTTDITIHVKGIVIVAGTSGNFTMDWAQAASDAGATIVRTNSYMTLRRVA